MLHPLVLATERTRREQGGDPNSPHMCFSCQACYVGHIKQGNCDEFTPTCNLSTDIQIAEVVDNTNVTNVEKVYIEYSTDPVAWAEMELGVSFEGRDYQKEILRCSAQKRVMRLGRRSGKTFALAIDMLFSMSQAIANDKPCKMLLTTPYQDQIELVFNMLMELLDKSMTLKNTITRTRQSSSYVIEFGSADRYIRGATAGTKTGSKASKIRGQDATHLYFDEVDSLSYGDIETIMAIRISHPNVRIWASGTPLGKREHFYKWSTSPQEGWKAFHFPASVSPNWTPQLEEQLRRDYTESAYKAEFCLSGDTKVRRLDGSVVQIKDLRIGDQLVSNTGQAVPCTVIDHRLTKQNTPVLEIGTDFGSVVCTPEHSFKTQTSTGVSKQQARLVENLLFSPSSGVYNLGREHTLARLVGYVNGDGSVLNQSCKKPRKRGSMEGNYRASFYGSQRDMHNVATDLNRVFGINASACFKAGNTYQISCSGETAKQLIQLGAVVGKKTQQLWTVPDWIRNHNDLSVKMEFIGALWGAEGSTPKANKNGRSIHSLSMSMCKKDDSVLSDLFEWIVDTLAEAGIPCSVTRLPIKQRVFTNPLGYKGKTNCSIIENITVHTSPEKNNHFYKTLPVRYCVEKEDKFFLFARHMELLLQLKESEDKRAKTILQLRADKKTIEAIAAETGATYSQVREIIDKKRKGRLSNNAPSIHDIRITEGGSIVAPIRWKKELPSQDVYNITVDSIDHSYLLDKGVNTYNCAEFPQLAEGVFPARLVDASLKTYNPESIVKQIDSWIYGVGVDWNSALAGVHIVLVGFNKEDEKFWFLRKWIISSEEYTQLVALDKIAEINRFWQPSFIYVDAGFGDVQISLLRKMGQQDPGSKLVQRVKPVNMSSKTKVMDPYLGRLDKHTKPLMVNCSVRRFEQNRVVIPKSEYSREGSGGLVDQLLNFTIKRLTPDGRPVYSQGEEHTLTAWMLAIFGFWMEHTDLAIGRLATGVCVVTEEEINRGIEEKEPDIPFGTITFKATGGPPPDPNAESAKSKQKRLLPTNRGFDVGGPNSSSSTSVTTLQSERGRKSELRQVTFGRAPSYSRKKF